MAVLEKSRKFKNKSRKKYKSVEIANEPFKKEIKELNKKFEQKWNKDFSKICKLI